MESKFAHGWLAAKVRYVVPFVLLLAGLLCALPMRGASELPLLPDSALLDRPFGTSDRASFAHPDNVFYPEVWVECLCGNMSEKGVTADLEAIAQAGFRGVQFFFGNRGGAWPGVEQIRFFSPQWQKFVVHAANEAKRLGLRFTLQNCPGWAMAGGPWIEPADAMRHLVMSRTDVIGGGDVYVSLPVDGAWLSAERDYHDVAVLAFPTPEGDTGEALISTSVTSSYEGFPWHACVEGQGGGQLPATTAEAPHVAVITLAESTVLRTLVLSSVQAFNHWFCYEPAVHVRVDALYPDGAEQCVLDTDMPQSNWQDNCAISLACADAPATDRYRVSIANGHPMSLSALRLLSAARKNNWESESARTLRSLMSDEASMTQNPAAYVVRDKVIDLTDNLAANGTLHARLPEGKWTVLRMGHVNTGCKNAPAVPEATGFECNKLSVVGAHKHFAGYVGKLAQGPLQGLLDGMLLDSWECETQTWTETMEQEFAQLLGYDLRSYLPALFGYVMDDVETTACFLRDWRSVINDLSVNRFYGEMTRLGHQQGLTVTYETAAGDVFPADIMEYFKFADIPMCEFWVHPTEEFVGTLNFKPIKPTASAAHLYGKRRVAAEGFTSMVQTWDEELSRLREVANVNMSEGVSYLVFQAYTHNPRPDELVPGSSFGDGIGTPFLRSQTWWRHMHAFTDYTARCSYMLERGRPVADVLWYLGDEIDHKPDQRTGFADGFKFDYCNPDVLLHRLSVKEGRICTPEGLSYSLMWLPSTRRMLPETLERLQELVSEGAVIVGDAPQAPATLQGGDAARLRFQTAVEALWGTADGQGAYASGIRHVRKGLVLSGFTPAEAVEALGLHPDVVSAQPLLWFHRAVAGADWYMVSPQPGQSFSGSVAFRSTGRVEIWDPVNGLVSSVPAKAEDDHTTVQLDMPQGGSCFVVFRHDGRNRPARHKVREAEILPFNPQWTLTFPSGWGIEEPYRTDSLCSWTQMDIPAEARAFSGTVTYTASLTVDKMARHRTYKLDLGQVEQVAAVSVNGQLVQTLWTEPYSTDITRYLHPGENTLSIDVTNVWFNRLLWDVRQPEPQRKTWTTNWPPANADYHPGGLLGPVKLRIE